MRYAEVIGDPVRQSKSPIIHRFWLEQLKLPGDYRRTHVPRGTLDDFFDQRRGDPDWRGCNVTIPHKEDAAALIDQLDTRAQAIGAVNCVVPRRGGLLGTNTDVDGIAAALDSSALSGKKAVVIGGGGASRAAIAYLAGRNIGTILILVRDPGKAEPLRKIAAGTSMEIAHLGESAVEIGGAAAIINATQLGMSGSPPMSDDLIAAVARHAPDAMLFDMVYEPLETSFLASGRARGARVVDGLTMLVGQAARAFELFYGARPPVPGQALRAMLATAAQNTG